MFKQLIKKFFFNPKNDIANEWRYFEDTYHSLKTIDFKNELRPEKLSSHHRKLALGGLNDQFYDYLFGENTQSFDNDKLAEFVADHIHVLLLNPDELLSELPVLPDSLTEISNQLQDNDFNAATIIELLNKEPAIAAKVVQLANSSTYQKRDKSVTNLKAAFLRLGAKGVREGVINGFMKQLIPQNNLYFQFYGLKLWQHSVNTGKIAKNLLEQSEHKHLSCEAYLIGLIHNLGNIVVYQLLLDAFAIVPPEYSPGSKHFKKLLRHHAQLLTYQIAQHWKFPEKIIRSLEKQTVINGSEELAAVLQTDALSGYVYEANIISQAIQLKQQKLENAERLYKNTRVLLHSQEAINTLDSLFKDARNCVA